tara:strand:- start:6260 stop:7219 length:960 start_codon:yes stop_codon:yes gene_type:complete
MSEMGKAMMGTGEASGDGRAIAAAEAAIANPLIDDVSLKGAKGLIINITGGKDITLYEVDEAANRIKQEVDEEANIIYGTTCDDRLEGLVRVSIVATGIDANLNISASPIEKFAPININNEIYKNEEVKVDNQSEPLESSLGKNIETEVYNNQTNNIDTLEDDNIIVDDIKIDNDIENSFSKNLETEDQDNELKVDDDNTNQDIHSEIEITENIPENFEETDKVSETSVRRLSLFDTLSTESLGSTSNDNSINDKSEPTLSSDDMDIRVEHSKENELLEEIDKEFNPDENDTSELEEEFNQENEEELLDIPTFLRRQAN